MSKLNRSLWKIRLSVFISGAVGMSLELVGSRLLAPTFGDSIFVWGSLIGIVMTGLAAGYYIGGKLADKGPSFRTFSLVVLLAGVLILAIPSISPIIMELTTSLGDRFGPLASSLLLLALPTTLLGVVSPYAIKLATENIESVGGVSGSLYAISTGGSIFGTFFTVFALIPMFGVRIIIYSLGLALVALSLFGLLWMERMLFLVISILLIFPPYLLYGPMEVMSGSLIYSTETPYSTLTVVENKDEGIRILYLNNQRHSGMYINGSQSAALRYTDYFNTAFLFNSNIKKVLFIGGGGFSGPKQFLAYYPNLLIDVVEIDPDVVRVAKEFFEVIDDPRLRIFTEDGRNFLRKSEKYDLIILDAYSKSYVPFHLMTVEFFEEVYNHLNPGGVVASNLIASLIGDTSDLLRAEHKTISQFFPQIYLFYTRSSSAAELQNLMLVATTSIERRSPEQLMEIALSKPQPCISLPSYSRKVFDYPLSVSDVPILTDDYAPAENLLNPVTLAAYESGDELNTSALFNPLLLAGAWITPMAATYIIWIYLRRALPPK